MAAVEDLEKRVEKLKDNLQKAIQESESTPAPDKVRGARKRLKRTQRKLRALKRAKAEAKQKREGKAGAPAPAA